MRAGAQGLIAGMLYLLFLLSFMLVAAPLASYILLAALAAMLVVVAWNMVEKSTAIGTLVRLGAHGRRAGAVQLFLSCW